MPSEPPKPYATPTTEECLAEPEIARMKRQLLPPLAPWRLAVAIALVTGTLVAVWALVHHQQFYCIIVATMCANQIPKVLDPHDLRFGSNSTHSFLWQLAGSGVFVAFFAVWLLWRELPVVSAVLQHPVSYGLVWIVSCGFLLRDWLKRRNNPPYRPEPHLSPAEFSRWKRMRRPGIR